MKEKSAKGWAPGQSGADSRPQAGVKGWRRRWGAAWGLLACLLLFMPQQGQGQEVKPIRIGATVSLSGKYQEPSAMIREAMKLWESQVNQRGGLLGRPVQLILYDDQSNKERARELYRQLIEKDKVDLVLSPYGTPLTMVASEVTEPHKYVMLVCGAAGEIIWERGYKYIFGVYAPAKRFLIGFLDLVARQGLQTVAILYENSPFNTASAQGAKEWAGRLGLKVSAIQAYWYGKTELPDLVPKMLEARPDALILCSYPKDSYILLELLKQAKYRPKAICETIGPAHPDFYKKAGSMAEGIFAPSQWEPDTRIPFPGTKEFIKSFEELAQKPPSYHAGTAYAACQILEKAITHTQSLDQGKLRDYILSLDTVTIIGRFRVDRTGMQVGHNPILIQWQKGKKEIVYPTAMQTAAPLF
jgi:branched-chain amino acid transport system substrate-binding protein